MLISLEQAEAKLLSVRPAGTKVLGRATYLGKHLFLAPFEDPLEGFLLPFFAVDPSTGEVSDFDPQSYDNPLEVLDLLDPVPDTRG